MKQSLDSQMIDGVFSSSKKSPMLSKYDAGAKVCPAIVPRPYQEGAYVCARMVYNATRICPSCGHVFYPSKAKNNDENIPLSTGILCSGLR